MKRQLLFATLLFFSMARAQFCVDYITSSDDIFTAYLTDGTTYTWGKNQYGQLGNGGTSSVSTFQPTVNAAQWSLVRHGRTHTIALDHEGNMWAWGNNAVGQLGNGTSDAYSYAPVSSGSSGWVTISAGNLHSVGLKQDGTLWGWGNNAALELYEDGEQSFYNTPIQLSPDTDWVYVYAGYFKTYGIKADGTLWGRGRNNMGDLGTGDNFPIMSFTQIGTDNNWVKVSAARGNYTMGLKSDNTLWAWGDNENGRLGIGSMANQNAPVQIPGQWKDVSAGNTQCVAIKTDGTLWSWGSYGWIDGAIPIPNTSVPVQLGTDSDWVSVMAGNSTSFGIKEDNSLWAWGFNTLGWFGNGNTISSTVPILISSCPQMSAPEVQVSALSIYPNPANAAINWNSDFQIKSYEISNVLGQSVQKGSASGTSIEIPGLANGVYLLRLESENGKSYSSKFVKQ